MDLEKFREIAVKLMGMQCLYQGQKVTIEAYYRHENRALVKFCEGETYRLADPYGGHAIMEFESTGSGSDMVTVDFNELRPIK